MHDDMQVERKKGYKSKVECCGLGKESVRLDKLKLCKQIL